MQVEDADTVVGTLLQPVAEQLGFLTLLASELPASSTQNGHLSKMEKTPNGSMQFQS